MYGTDQFEPVPLEKGDTVMFNPDRISPGVAVDFGVSLTQQYTVTGHAANEGMVYLDDVDGAWWSWRFIKINTLS